MGKKTERDRQKRLQRKREKQAARRAARGPRRMPFGGYFDDEAFGLPPRSTLPAEIAAAVDACEALLTGESRLDSAAHPSLQAQLARADAAWRQLPFELNAFLHHGAPWSRTCAELEALRSAFEAHGAEEVFQRLWTLSLTNAAEAGALAAATEQDCAHRATLAFQDLFECLDDPARKHAAGLAAVVREIERHEGRAGIKKAAQKLLQMAIASVHLQPPQRGSAAIGFAAEVQACFERFARHHAETAWWHCMRAFLREVFERHALHGCNAEVTAQRAALEHVFGAAGAVIWLARHGGSAEPLRSVHFRSGAGMDAWLAFLSSIDPRTLAFEDRLRYEIARLKLLRARAHALARESAAAASREFLAAFEQLRALLAHGVPPAQRELPGMLEPALIDFYVEALEPLHAEGTALETTQALFERHPRDFRLACLYAAGALLREQPDRLATLQQQEAYSAHFDAELFARCAIVWAHLPGGAKAAARLRAALFDPLDREQRKQCLLKLAQHVLRRAANRSDYEGELRKLLPYFDRTNFISRELRQGATLEPALVFFASMMAPVQGARLALNESQSQQWLSYAREIAGQSAAGADIVTHYLQKPSPWIGLAPEAFNTARAQLGDFQALHAATRKRA